MKKYWTLISLSGFVFLFHHRWITGDWISTNQGLFECHGKIGAIMVGIGFFLLCMELCFERQVSKLMEAI